MMKLVQNDHINNNLINDVWNYVVWNNIICCKPNLQQHCTSLVKH